MQPYTNEEKNMNKPIVRFDPKPLLSAADFFKWKPYEPSFQNLFKNILQFPGKLSKIRLMEHQAAHAHHRHERLRQAEVLAASPPDTAVNPLTAKMTIIH